MKRNCLYIPVFSFLFIVFSLNVFSQQLILEGNYRGKNIYVQNPFSDSAKFCVYKVTVTGKEVAFENASAFEIELDSLGLKIGEMVRIEIKHYGDCKPKVLPDHSTPRYTFEAVSMTVDSAGMLIWKTKKETGKWPYIIEQYRWNKWIKVGEVDGKGNYQMNEYSFRVPFHSGENQYRVKQVNYSGQSFLSKPVNYFSSQDAIQIKSYTVKDTLTFSNETLYEIYDIYGNVVKKGTGKEADCSRLSNGKYFLNYDNVTYKEIKIEH